MSLPRSNLYLKNGARRRWFQGVDLKLDSSDACRAHKRIHESFVTSHVGK